jgi:hypothetical protein
MLKQSLLSVFALLALAATQACAAAAPPSGEEENSGGGQTSSNGPSSTAGARTVSGGTTSSAGGSTPTGTAPGGASPAGGANGSGTSGSGSSAGGASGASVSGASAGGASVSSAGAGGSTISGAGASAAGSSAGAGTATQFGQVSSLLAKRCSGSKCHGSGATNLAFANATGSTLHSLLTSPIPASVPHCVGVTLVTPNNTSSPLVEIVMSGGKIACTNPKSESEGPMPDKCSTTSTSQTGVCLTAAEIKVITDWISAGAPD